MQNGVIKMRLAIDGNYARVISDRLSTRIEGDKNFIIRWDKFKDYTVRSVSDIEGAECTFSKCDYYIGSDAARDARDASFRESMDIAGIQRVAFPLRSSANGRGVAGLKEDAVDTSLVFNIAKEFYTTKENERFRYLILVAGDSDFVPLVNGLAAEGVKTIVVYFDFADARGTTRAGQALLDAAYKVISLENLLRERVDATAKAVFEEIASDAPAIVHAPPIVKKHVFVVRRNVEHIPADDLTAAINACFKDADGWALASRVGDALERVRGRKLPYGVKLRDELAARPDLFETKELPAFSVRLLHPSASSQTE